ncbi:transposase [Streptomyces sp. SAI-170]
MLIGPLLGHDQPMVYLTGLAVHQASAAYPGQGKTGAKDAFVIADQARMRKDLGVLRPGDEITVDLKILVRRRTDLVNDRTRQINRLREQLLEICPALERALSLTNKGPILLLTGYQTPAAIRRSGAKRIETWLKNRKVKGASVLAQAAVEAAQAQHTALPGERLAASMVARLAKGVMAVEEEITELDALIEARFHEHPHANVIRSLPGMGAMLGATFIAATGGDMKAFGTADRLAAFAGLSPVPRDSGRVSGNMRREVQGVRAAEFRKENLVQPGPLTSLVRLGQAPPAGHARPKVQFLRQVLPGDPGVQHEQDALEHHPVRRPLASRMPRPTLDPGQQRLDHRPQLVVNFPRLQPSHCAPPDHRSRSDPNTLKIISSGVLSLIGSIRLWCPVREAMIRRL